MEWMILPLRRYAQFSGRSQRKEFWMWVLFVIVVTIVLSIVDSALGFGGYTQYGKTVVQAPGVAGYQYGAGTRGGILTGIFSLAILIPNLAVSVRRLHDTDRSGWWILLPVIPYLVVFITMMLSVFGGIGIGTGTGMAAIMGIFGVAALICLILLLVWYCLDGTHGPNRFGPDPKRDLGDLQNMFG